MVSAYAYPTFQLSDAVPFLACRAKLKLGPVSGNPLLTCPEIPSRTLLCNRETCRRRTYHCSLSVRVKVKQIQILGIFRSRWKLPPKQAQRFSAGRIGLGRGSWPPSQICWVMCHSTLEFRWLLHFTQLWWVQLCSHRPSAVIVVLHVCHNFGDPTGWGWNSIWMHYSYEVVEAVRSYLNVTLVGKNSTQCLISSYESVLVFH